MISVLEQVPYIKILGIGIHVLGIGEALEVVDRWILERTRTHVVVATGLHGVMESQRDPEFKSMINSADLSVPDGISAVWAARRLGFRIERRLSGSDLMQDLCELAEGKGYRVFFYGDTDETLLTLTHKLQTSFPNLKIAGVHSPPFRPLKSPERSEVVEMINRSGADIVFVGLGLPKQEKWMFDIKSDLTVPVLVGVGAAFKFISGQVTRAPDWVGNWGFEWLWRFLQEPRRVWRRVLVDGPRFLILVGFEIVGLRRFD